MELTLNRGVLGQYDTGSSLRYKGKEKYVDKFFEYVAGAIAIIAAVVLFFSCLGACMGCQSVLSCYDGCSCSCAKNIVQACYDSGEACRTSAGCKPSSSSSSSSHSCTPSTTTSTTTYKAINGVTGQYDYWYVKSYKSGCRVVSTDIEEEYAVDDTYWRLEGIYTNSKMNKEVTLESMKPGKVYYTNWTKIDEGVEYTLSFTLSGLSGQSSVLSTQHANVGADIIDWDQVWSDVYYNLPVRDNYVFKGIYYNDVQIVDEYGNVNTDFNGAFDLETWGIIPGNRKVSVEIRYEPTQINVKFVSIFTDETITEGEYDYGASLYSIIYYNSKLNAYTIDTYNVDGREYSLYDLQWINLEKDITVYVDAHKDYYSLKIYDLDGNLMENGSVRYNTSYLDIIIHDYLYYYLLEHDEITGFSFDSSSQSKIYTLEDLEDMVVTSDVVLYPRAVRFYTIVLHVGNSAEQTRIPEENLNLPTPEKEGYTFGGWYLTPEFIGTPITELSYCINNNITDLYAKLTGRQYTIYFYDGVIENIPVITELYTTSVNDYKSLPGEDSFDIPQGYTFGGGWYDRDDENKTLITKIEAGDSGDKYLIAVLIPNKYNVVLRPGDNGTLPTSDRVQVIDYGSTPTLPISMPKEEKRDGYEFKGYMYNGTLVTDSEGKFTQKFTEELFGMTFADFSAYETNSIKLDACIEIKKFSVTLINHGQTISVQEVAWSSYPTLSSLPTPLQGDVFDGWNRDPEATFAMPLEEVGIQEDTTLYAIYSKVSVKITYVNKDETVKDITLPSDDTAYIKYSKEKDTLNAVSKPDYSQNPYYEFDGYYYGSIKVADETGKLLINFTETSLGITYDTLVQGIELEVSSKLREFTVIFYDKNNQYGESQTLHYNDHVTKPEDPIPRDGYSFTYWTLYNSSSEFNFNAYSVQSNISLYSNYVANKYTINLEVLDFKDKSSVSLPYATLELTYDGNIHINKPAYPTSNDYEFEFVGYYIGDKKLTDANGDVLNDLKFNINSLSSYGATNIQKFEDHITVSAKYQPKQFTVTYYGVNNTSVYQERTVYWGNYATSIEGPQKEGYMFVGWGKYQSNDTLYDFTNNTVKNNLVLYPKYTNKVSVNLYAQDGINPLTTFQINYGQPLVISNDVYNSTGVREWYLREDPTEIIAEWVPEDGIYIIYPHSWSSTFTTNSVIGEINLIAGSN